MYHRIVLFNNIDGLNVVILNGIYDLFSKILEQNKNDMNMNIIQIKI